MGIYLLYMSFMSTMTLSSVFLTPPYLREVERGPGFGGAVVVAPGSSAVMKIDRIGYLCWRSLPLLQSCSDCDVR
jgi:hypothetical protein